MPALRNVCQLIDSLPGTRPAGLAAVHRSTLPHPQPSLLLLHREPPISPGACARSSFCRLIPSLCQFSFPLPTDVLLHFLYHSTLLPLHRSSVPSPPPPARSCTGLKNPGTSRVSSMSSSICGAMTAGCVAGSTTEAQTGKPAPGGGTGSAPALPPWWNKAFSAFIFCFAIERAACCWDTP